MDRNFELLSSEVTKISERLDRLEKLLSSGATQPTRTAPPPTPIKTTSTDYELKKTRLPPSPAELHISSSTFLGSVAVLCFVLAAAYLIKLTIDSGWLTHFRQLCLTGLLGFSLVLTGIILKEKFSEDRTERSYASLLSGAGIIVLFLASFAGSLYYQILSSQQSAIFATITSLLAIYLYKVFLTDFFIVSSTCGTYLIPFILGRYDWNFSELSSYFIGWALLFSYLAIKLDTRIMIILASYLGIGGLGVLIPPTAIDSFPTVWAPWAQLLQFIIFTTATITFSVVKDSPLTKSETFALSPLLLWFYSTEFILFQRLSSSNEEELAPLTMIGIAIAVSMGYKIAQNYLGRSLASFALVENLIAVTLFHSVYIELIPAGYRPLLCMALLSIVHMLKKQEIFRPQTFLMIASLLLIPAIETFQIFIRLLFANQDSINVLWTGYGIVFSGALIVYGITRESSIKDKLSKAALLTIGHLLAISTLYHILHSHGSLVISAVMGIYALGVYFAGYKLKNKLLAKSSLVVFLSAIVKVFFFDLTESSPLLKIFCLLLTGVVVYVGGLLLKKIDNWE